MALMPNAHTSTCSSSSRALKCALALSVYHVCSGCSPGHYGVIQRGVPRK
jgi:hypothetical protein